MALIECTECGHKVSDKAECCPNCGCPIEEIMSADASNDTNVSQVYDDAVQFDDIPPKKSKGWLWTIVVILVLAAIGVGVWLFTNGKLGEDDPTTAKVEITPEFIAAVHQYDELYPFSEGLAAVKKDGKFGYIDTKGNLVIPCQFGYASDFIEGTAVVAKDDGMPYCILNRDGRVVETKYILKDNSRYIESDGSLSQSSETHILNGEVREYVGFYTLTEKKDNGDNVAHYLDKNLKEVTEPSESLLRDFAPDSVYTEYFESGKDYLGDDENLSGLKDKKGTIIIPARYKYVRMCDNGVALAEIRVEPADFHQEGLTVFGYIDLNGNSTFTDADFKKIEAYKQEQLAKKEELDRQAAEEEQARLEEERRQEESQKGPEWINGVWECHEMVDLGYFGRQRANARLSINRDAQTISSNNDGMKYNGSYYVSDNTIHFGDWYANLDNYNERIEYGNGIYYRKVSNSPSSSSNSSRSSHSTYNNSSNTTFRTPSDVLSYTSSNSFYNCGDCLRIGFDAVYLNDTALTGAPRVTNISGSSATIIASNPYGGRALHFYVNASSGTITQNGDVYRAR